MCRKTSPLSDRTLNARHFKTVKYTANQLRLAVFTEEFKMIGINNKKFIATVVISLLMSTAIADKKPDADYQEKIDRIITLDVTEEVQKDINEDRLRLYVMHNRGGTIIPGISEDVKPRLSSVCEKVVLQDAGDVVYSPTHLKYMTLVVDYATEYNKQMEGLCIK